MTLLANEVWRDFETAGVPASGPNEPIKAEIRSWGTWLESLLNAFGNPSLAYGTQAALNADLLHSANTLAAVYADPVPANNGLYIKTGASGSGGWARIGDLPGDVIRFTVTGGTGNTIVATAPETPSVPGDKLYLMTPTANNTAATTISVNGTPPAPVKNAFGSTLASGSLVTGSQVLMAWQVDHYQLLISAVVDGSAILADTVAARDAAATSAASAASAAAALGNQVHQYDTRAQAIAATIPVGVQAIKVTRWSSGAPLSYATYIPGTSAGPAAFQESGGNYWELDLGSGDIDACWFGLLANSTLEDTTFATVLTWAKTRIKPVKLPKGTIKLANSYLLDWNEAQISGVSMRSTLILFDPPAHDRTLFKFHMTGVAGGLFNGALRDMTINTTGINTFRKTAVQINNGDCCSIERFNIQNWLGSGTDVGLRLCGREFTTVKQCLINAEIPIMIEQNPDRALVGNIDCDMMRITDLWLIGANTTTTLVQVSSAVNITSLSFDGYQSWNLGAGGFVWNDAPTQISSMLSFYNVRYEQGAAGAFMFLINRSGTPGLYNLHFQNCFSGTSGYYLRGVVNATIINHASQGPSATAYGIDADGANVRSISLVGCSWIGTGSGILKNLPNMQYKGGAAIAALPVSGELWSTTLPPTA